MFVVNLALSDLTFSAVNGFPLLTLSAFNKRWIFGKVGQFCTQICFHTLTDANFMRTLINIDHKKQSKNNNMVGGRVTSNPKCKNTYTILAFLFNVHVHDLLITYLCLIYYLSFSFQCTCSPPSYNKSVPFGLLGEPPGITKMQYVKKKHTHGYRQLLC